MSPAPANDSLIEGRNSLSAAARLRLLSRRFEPLFIADWERALMIHFEVDADELRRVVPFHLDLWEGRAFVSLVAFTMRGMRTPVGGKLAAALLRPIATHEFLNVRAYVRHGLETGIYFLSEWLSNRLSVRLGPTLFGLPYRHGRMNYLHHHEGGTMRGEVNAVTDRFAYAAELDHASSFTLCPAGSLDEFLMERYTAFTCRSGRARFFRVWHEPWPQASASVQICDASLLTSAWPWFRHARLDSANYSPGVRDVWMGRPRRCPPRSRRRSLSRFFEMP